MQPSLVTTERKLMDLGNAIEAFLQNVSNMSKSTADTYRFRLYPFVYYAKSKHAKTPDELIAAIRSDKLDVYDILSDYASYLQSQVKKNGRGAASVKRRVSVVKDVLTFKDIDISDNKFKAKVKLPKTIRRKKAPIDKNDIIRILQACTDIKTKTYIMMLAATGMRAKEALSIQFQGLDFKSNPAKVYIRGEFTKTRSDRFVYLTRELVSQLKDYIAWRQRERDIYYYDEKNKGKTVRYKPEKKPTDLIFAVPHRDGKNADIESMYKDMLVKVNAVVDRVGLGELDPSNGFRKVTRHSFRRFVKTTISNLGYADYSEFFIGHIGSEYYTAKEREAVEIFRKIEPNIMFLDVIALEKQGATFSDKVEQQENVILEQQRQIAKMKGDIKEEVRKQVAEAVRRLKPQVVKEGLS
jgi:integrase